MTDDGDDEGAPSTTKANRGRAPKLEWLNPRRIRVDGFEFVLGWGEDPDAFQVVKEPANIRRFASFFSGRRGSVVVEVGVFRGGSAALIALLNEPERLVAIDLHRVEGNRLDHFIDQRGLHDVVRPYYGVDQADAAALHRILDAELGDRPIDIVFDDASHQYAETLATFEALFPRLRPGGHYLIEDWCWETRVATDLGRGNPDELTASQVPEGAPIPDLQDIAHPLNQLALELVLARSTSSQVIGQVTLTPYWINVRRGLTPLPPGPFRLADHAPDPFGFRSDRWPA